MRGPVVIFAASKSVDKRRHSCQMVVVPVKLSSKSRHALSPFDRCIVAARRPFTTMDDDFGFGTAIWATSSTDATTSQAVDRPHEPVFPSFNGTSKEQSLVAGTNPFEYSDDFNFASSSEHITNMDDDDFGEFGDFDEGDGTGALGTFVQDGAFEDTTLQDRPVASGSTTTDWFALQLDPFPSSSVLRENVEQTLHPLWERINMDVHLSDDDIRQVGGLSQVLVTPER